jgi:monofunctional biosynthetic peptidoglycan transglycosylase
MIFAGRLSLENNGGFASVRRRPAVYALSGTDGVVLRIRGDGRSYQFRVRTHDRFDGVAYRALFDTDAERWETVRIPFSDFRATYRGRPVPGAPPLDPKEIRQIGFLIADKRSGSFRLEIDMLGVWLAEEKRDSD